VELLELWRRHLEKTKSERTTITYLNAIKSFLKKLQLPSHKLVEVSSADLYQYADSSELSSTSLLTHFSALRHFYRFLARRGYLQKELHLPAEITKRKKERIAPLIGPTKEETFRFTQELSRWLEDYDANLRTKAGSLQVYTNRLSKRLGIDFSLHSFRHTYITNLINQGFPAELVKEFAGHANVKTTIDIYYRFNPERAKAVVDEFLRG
jgi:integrase/recombinase XerD